MDIREHFFQHALRRTTFDRNTVQIYWAPLPERLKDAPVRRYVIDNGKIWRVQSIEGETVHCREATNQELADIREAEHEHEP